MNVKGFFFDSRIGYYKDTNFQIVPLEGDLTNIHLKIKAYDKEEAGAFYIAKRNLVTNFFSTQFLAIIQEREKNEQKELDKEELFIEDFEQEINNDFNVVDGFFLLTRKAKHFIKVILEEDTYSPVFTQFLKAAKLFHEAMKLEQKAIYSSLDGINYYELAHTSYMSALEVLSFDPNQKVENCSNCGQLQFSVLKRVKALVKKSLSKT